MKNKITIVFLLLSMFAVSTAKCITPPYKSGELLNELIRLNDADISNSLKWQWTDKDNVLCGAIFDGDSIVSPIGTAHFIQKLMCSYVSPVSTWYQSTELLNRMVLAAHGMITLQHPDGTIDLVNANFHSTPDLGFTIYPLALAYSIMLQNKNLNYGELNSLIKRYMLKAGDALTVGGVHTPNHRWVITGALAWLYQFFPDPKYKARAEQWLAEKVDIDPDGQYHERSTAVYTPVTNRSLIDIAQKMHFDYLYKHVRKNLDMTFYFVRSTGEIATESSNRQDKYIVSDMSGYYRFYRFMALKDMDSRYSGMVAYIEKTVPLANLGGMLPYFIEDPSMLQELPKPIPLPTRYEKQFKYSDMVRIRDGERDMSIISNNSTFFSYFKGTAALEGMRLSAAFFGRGQFQSEKIEKVGDTYILSSTIKGPYYQPLPKDKIPVDGEAWGKVPRTEREQSEIQTLDTKIYITRTDGKVKVKVVVNGPENLPVSLELGFRQGGTLINVTKKVGAEAVYLMKSGATAQYSKDGNTITIGPGICKHKTTQLRGALPKLQADCLYFTMYAPNEFEFTIE
jgi:hypothetical protein